MAAPCSQWIARSPAWKVQRGWQLNADVSHQNVGVTALINDVWAFGGRNAAAIIALCALGLTIYQAFLARRHNHMSVRPILSSWTERVSGHEARLSYSLTNSGLGPALIDSFQVTLDGAPINLRATDEVNAILSRLLEQPARFTVGALSPESTIRTDETRQILDVQFSSTSPAHFEGVLARFDRLRLVVHYRSLYNKRYVFDSVKKADG